MSRLVRERRRPRRGFIAVIVAVSLIAMLGVAALALDGGLLLDNRRRAQAAADASALAAATQLFTNFPAIAAGNADPGGKGASSALSVAANNGYANDGSTSVRTGNIPPQSRPFGGKP